MSASIARYLKDFGEASPGVTDAADSAETLFAAGPMSFPETVDIESEKSAAFEQGREAAASEWSKRLEVERDERFAAHAAEIEALRIRYQEELAGMLAGRLREGTEALAARMSDEVAAVLAPVLTQKLRDKAAASLADQVRAAIADGEVSKLVVKGSPEMFERFKTAIGLDAERLHFVASDDLDLSVEIDESVLVTRMSAWAFSLRKVLK